jgi:hypothetical protein
MSKQPVQASQASLANLRINTDPAEEAPTPPAHQPETYSLPHRAGKTALILRIDPDLHRELKTSALNGGTTMQNLVLDALRKAGFKSAVPDK